jgi:hypothetical protein
MRTAKHCLTAGLALVLLANAFATGADDSDMPKHTIKEVMKIAHAGKAPLYKKVLQGKGTAEDKKELVELYVDLTKDTPAKGSPESWKAKTQALVSAARDVADDKPNATASLKQAANCAGCHRIHKPQNQ